MDGPHQFLMNREKARKGHPPHWAIVIEIFWCLISKALQFSRKLNKSMKLIFAHKNNCLTTFKNQNCKCIIFKLNYLSEIFCQSDDGNHYFHFLSPSILHLSNFRLLKISILLLLSIKLSSFSLSRINWKAFGELSYEWTLHSFGELSEKLSSFYHTLQSNKICQFYEPPHYPKHHWKLFGNEIDQIISESLYIYGVKKKYNFNENTFLKPK